MNFTYEDDGKKALIIYTGNTVVSSYEYKLKVNHLLLKIHLIRM